MRLLPILIPALLLAGCGETAPDRAAIANAEAGASEAADATGRIECAPAAAAQFTRSCTLDREMTATGLMLTARNPEGGFHRLIVTKDGRGVIAADGAERADVRIIGADRIEVSIGGDRYRLPATVRARR